MKNTHNSEESGKEKRSRNPYLAPLVTRFLLLLFFMFAYAKWFSHTSFSRIIYIMIAMLVFSNVHYVTYFFKFRKFKKKHPEPGFDQHYYETETAIDNFNYHPRR